MTKQKMGKRFGAMVMACAMAMALAVSAGAVGSGSYMATFTPDVQPPHSLDFIAGNAVVTNENGESTVAIPLKSMTIFTKTGNVTGASSNNPTNYTAEVESGVLYIYCNEGISADNFEADLHLVVTVEGSTHTSSTDGVFELEAIS